MRTLVKFSFLIAVLGSSLGFAGQPATISEKVHGAMMQSCMQMESVKMNGQPDHDFVVMMIPHHQGAIDAAKAYLTGATDPEIIQLAKNVIAAQEEEIAKFQDWLKQHQ